MAWLSNLSKNSQKEKKSKKGKKISQKGYFYFYFPENAYISHQIYPKKEILMAYVTINVSFFGNIIPDDSSMPGEPGNNV